MRVGLSRDQPGSAVTRVPDQFGALLPAGARGFPAYRSATRRDPRPLVKRVVIIDGDSLRFDSVWIWGAGPNQKGLVLVTAVVWLVLGRQRFDAVPT